ncbi:MAG: glycine-rich domain-containing protein [Ilumatobacteraceae bacterium]
MSSRRLLMMVAAVSALALPAGILPGESVAAESCPASLTGGSVSTAAGDCVLSWPTVGTYTWTPPAWVTELDVLVVAGGGGGGADAAGGGGGGGVIYQQGLAVAGAKTVTVGAGGVGGRNSTGTTASNGANSVFGALTAIGGGRGGTYRGGAGANGGSGGGGGFDTGVAGTGTAGQGNAGGDGIGNWHSGPAAGGGGGAGGPGTAGNVGDGNGGPGRTVNITGTNVTYGGGGGGGRWSVTSTIENGGSGGGGRGAGSCGANESMPGAANTGGGGGGAPAGCQTFGSAGGSGVVIVRYSLPDVTAPTRTGASINTAGTQLTVTWSETLSASLPAASAFTVRADGTVVPVSSVTASGQNVVLVLSSPVWQGAALTLAYADPTAGDDNNAVQDAAGNDAASFAAVPVTNSSTVTTTTTTTTTSTTSVPPATTSTVSQSTPTTAAPVLDVVVNAPATTVASPAATVVGAPVVQAPAPSVAVRSAGPTSVPAATTTSSTTSSTLPNNAGGTVAPPAPKVPVVVAGEAGVTVGDEEVPATVERLDNTLVVSAGGLKATFGSVGGDGATAALDNDGNVRLRPGDNVRISLAGFDPGSTVQAWLFSTPVLMGTAVVGDDGTVTSTFTIPDDAPGGAHRIAIVAATDGKPATLAVGVMVGDWGAERNLAVWLIAVTMLCAVAGALALPATRRRRRRATAA